MTRRFPFITLDVFTDRRFGGNPLAVFPDARGLSDGEMQALAAEFNLSETAFVLPPSDPANDARVRIFGRRAEMAFAGHPNVGVGFALAPRARGGRLRFEELAGLVEVRPLDGEVQGAEITAPQPLSTGPEMPPALLAGCVGLAAAEVRTGRHPPLVAGTGNAFVIAEVEPPALARAAPDPAAFRAAHGAFPHLGPRGLPVFLYAQEAPGAVRARMFAPLTGTLEDAATGSAATALAGLLLHLSGDARLRLTLRQGEEMGRPSRLLAGAYREDGAIRATVGGGCVPVLRGEALLDG